MNSSQFLNDKLNESLLKCGEYVDQVRIISDKLVSQYTNSLDELMKEVMDNVTNADNVSDDVICRYQLELSGALYFIKSNTESFGFYDDISKLNKQVAYNNAYSNNQLKALESNTKVTVKDNELAADMGSLDEGIVNIIYSRSYKIIKSKVEAAEEMVRTLSKTITARIADKQVLNNN